MGDSPENSDFAGDVSRLVEQAKEIQDSAASLISRTTLEEDALRRRLASLDAHINSLRNSKHADEEVCIHNTHAWYMDASDLGTRYSCIYADFFSALFSILVGRGVD